MCLPTSSTPFDFLVNSIVISSPCLPPSPFPPTPPLPPLSPLFQGMVPPNVNLVNPDPVFQGSSLLSNPSLHCPPPHLSNPSPAAPLSTLPGHRCRPTSTSLTFESTHQSPSPSLSPARGLPPFPRFQGIVQPNVNLISPDPVFQGSSLLLNASLPCSPLQLQPLPCFLPSPRFQGVVPPNVNLVNPDPVFQGSYVLSNQPFTCMLSPLHSSRAWYLLTLTFLTSESQKSSPSPPHQISQSPPCSPSPLFQGMVPPNVNLINPDPVFQGSFLPTAAAAPKPMRAVMSNSFGFGGTNASLVFGLPPLA
ncbi:unnamed protein product [Closterium sp. NIES-53]